MKYLILVLVLAFVIVACKKQQTEGVTLLSPSEAESYLSQEGMQVVDVRTPQEYNEGHLPNVKHIDFYHADFRAQLTNQLDKDKPVMVYCKSGGRSGKTAKLLKDFGFAEIYDIQGGFTKWKAKDLPIEK